MEVHELVGNILNDIRVELADEFDRNFQREAFFSKPWNPKAPHGLKLSGALRNSINAKVSGDSVEFSSQLPYAKIHNEGGTITVTPRMKRFFWRKYYQTGEVMYRNLALKKTGSTISMPQRQFIGYSDELTPNIEQIIRKNIEVCCKDITVNIQKQFDNG